MTTKHKKRVPLIRRLSSIVAVFAIFIMSMPMAMAADLSGSAKVLVFGGASSLSQQVGGIDFNFPVSSTTDIGSINNYNGYYYGVGNMYPNTDLGSIEGAVGIYWSYYFKPYQGNGFQSTGVAQKFNGLYTNHQGQTGTTTDVTTSTFTPQASNACSVGHSVSAKFVGSEDFPITNIRISNASTAISNAPVKQVSGSYALRMVVTSLRFVTTEYSAELGAMENMANEIAKQSEMMQAMYGEIIALCNAIYQKCGDLETAINLTNSYCSVMIEALSDIASTTENIYTLLGTQFALLISTIESESSNIQDAIAQAEAKLEAYLDSAVADSGIADSGTASEDASSTIGNLNDSSGEYESTASDSFAQISADFAGFSGGTLSGVALATDIFSQIFDSLGEYRIVYTFPLLLGVCLVLIGRISRHSGGASSRKEDKEE